MSQRSWPSLSSEELSQRIVWPKYNFTPKKMVEAWPDGWEPQSVTRLLTGERRQRNSF